MVDKKPIPGTDYPRTLIEFNTLFGTDQACADYLAHLRWASGFICPRCSEAAAPRAGTRGRLICRACLYQASVTAGTIFDKTRTPLRVWFAGVWYIVNQKHGVSALGLQRVLGLGSYETAWTMLHRLRRAMVIPGREQLHGLVEVDETFVSVTDAAKAAKGSRTKSKSNTLKCNVVIAIELLNPKGFGRLRLKRVPADTIEHLIGFVRETVAPGSTVHTDGSNSYLTLPQYGYVHERTVHTGSPVPEHVSMPGVHRVASLLKRWMIGTHQGAIRDNQIDAYLDEFVFRFNRRKSRYRGLLFYRLLQQAVVTSPVTYDNVINPVGTSWS